MHQSEALRTLQALLTTNGVYFAGQCVIALEEIVAKIPAAAYPTVLIVIWGGMPDEKRIAFQLESECGGFCVAFVSHAKERLRNSLNALNVVNGGIDSLCAGRWLISYLFVIANR